jgi:ribosomal protein S18 acetylase RimI-like enzyme
MAAASALATIVDLRYLRAERLEPLLEEESADWQRELDWDFRPSANLVRRFVGMQALTGYALCSGEEVIGYAYHVAEEHKGLIGDLYVREPWRTPAAVGQLLEATIGALSANPALKRIESQLMILGPQDESPLPKPDRARNHLRDFMAIGLGGVMALPESPAAARIHMEPWHERWNEASAQLIGRCYEGHVDGDINDQYRSPAGARRFLHNIVQYPGCGSFFSPASMVALDEAGQALGLCLSSLVAYDVGHVTQVCVAPEARGLGIGYELMRRSLGTLAAAGCRRTSLTVTSSNESAIALYRRMGFTTARRFRAIVWDLA